MVRICLHCGDKGISNALVYCDRCRNCAVHQYCLDKLPSSFDEPVHWVCEDCEDTMPIQSILNKSPKYVQENHSNFFSDASQLATNPNDLQHGIYGRAQPVIDPIWRGNFRILDEKRDTFEGLVAHLSSKACPKVCEEARLLPSFLWLEMLPKSDLWPKSFHGLDPSDDSIGLYFFPVDKSYERAFDHLVDDLISRELAMKANSKNAELLVFTSTELQKIYWRFQGKYYLWGVFRGKKASRKVEDSESQQSKTQLGA